MKTKYACEFCHGWTMGFDTAEACAKHEAECDLNPAVQSCASCRHYVMACQAGKVADNWKPKGGPWEDEDDIPEPMGCKKIGDQQWRKHCDQWEAKPCKP